MCQNTPNGVSKYRVNVLMCHRISGTLRLRWLRRNPLLQVPARRRKLDVPHERDGGERRPGGRDGVGQDGANDRLLRAPEASEEGRASEVRTLPASFPCIRVLWCISTVLCFAVLYACVCEHRERDGEIHDGELPPWNVAVERTLDGVL